MDPTDDIDEFIVPVSAEIAIVLSAKISDLPELKALLDESAQNIIKHFQKRYKRAFLRATQVRPMSQEELLLLVPRKIHLERQGKHICTTQFVSPKNLTKEPDKVTCILCKKMIKL